MKNPLSYIFIGLIWIYQYISPLFKTKPSCIFYPTCSEYAKIAFKKYSFFKALRKTLHRISRCHPGNEPGIDHP